MRKLSLALEELITTANPAQIKLGELLDTISQEGFGFLLVALSLPSALPISAWGYAVPFAVLISLVALQMIMGRSFSILPRRVRNKDVGSKMVTFIQKRGIPFLRRVERLSKPRLENLSERRFFRFLVGIVILVLALVLLIPIPFTNTIFAFAILLIGIGLMNKDGLFILSGGLLGLTAVVVIALLIAGVLTLYHLGG